MKKKWLSVLFSMAMVTVMLVGCGNKAPEKAPAEKKEVAEESGKNDLEKEVQKDTVVLKLAHHTAIDSAYDIAVKHYADLVNQRTDGRVKIEVYPAAQLGGERDVLEGLKLGTIDMSLNTSALIMNITPEFGLLDLPFLFEDYDHVKACLEGEPGKILADKLLEQNGIRMLGGWCSGFRVMLTSNKPIENLDDFKGLKMRSPETPVYIDMFTALGASPTPIPYSEVYTAMQTDVVEGVEVAAEPMYTSKFHEVGKYIVKTNHIFSTICPLINEKKFKSLPEDVQKIMIDTMKEATEFEWEKFIEADEAALQAMVDAGCQLNEIDRQPLADACAPVREKYEKDLNAKEFMDSIRSLQKK